MLFDPKWEQKPDVEECGISLAALTAWLALQPADQKYDANQINDCALAQYVQSCGVARKDSYVDVPLNGMLCEIAFTTPWTFGAALKRARKLAA
jgi:hypothetical protein